LWVCIGNDNGTVPGTLRRYGKMDGRGGFTGAALLIGNNYRFHERENRGFLEFIKVINMVRLINGLNGRKERGGAASAAPERVSGDGLQCAWLETL